MGEFRNYLSKDLKIFNQSDITSILMQYFYLNLK